MRRGGPQHGGRELTKRFQVLEFLGKGSYGSVYRVRRHQDNGIYAVKEMDVRTMGHAEKEEILNEVRLLASIRHPNVVSYQEAFVDGGRLCIVMEYAPGGDLSTTIKKHRVTRKPMHDDLIWKYFIQIVRGLQALHSVKIIHRDIKPGNILVTSDGVVKIADLGIAKLVRNNMARTQIGTPVYMAPEVWCNKPYSFWSDTWSLGCVLYEMATYNIPFDGRSMMELKQKILRGNFSPMPSYCSKEVRDMVKQCLCMRPEARPTMDRILGSPVVAQRLKLLPAANGTPASKVINTIKLPRHQQLGQVRLPPAMYSMDMDDIDANEPGVATKYYKPPSRAPSRQPSRAPSRNGDQRPRIPSAQGHNRPRPGERAPSAGQHRPAWNFGGTGAYAKYYNRQVEAKRGYNPAQNPANLRNQPPRLPQRRLW
ncbi:hypothetical protein BSKO_13604 [Bryopsis sp. KO-2023]|nr:hypothetical protein BSKO_13604 [Bryopsis sp. KO-2023]